MQIREYLIKQAVAQNVPVERVLYIVKHESHFKKYAVGDKTIICPSGKYKGKKVYARGIFQITRCYHPEISDMQAFDVSFATQWALPLIKNKKQCKRQWTVCKEYFR